MYIYILNLFHGLCVEDPSILESEPPPTSETEKKIFLVQ